MSKGELKINNNAERKDEGERRLYEGEQKVSNISLLRESIKNVSQSESINPLFKESLADIRTTLEEGGDDAANLLIAYRGLESARARYTSGEEDFGVTNVMGTLREEIKKKGFDIGEVEDLDQIFEKTKSDAWEAMTKSKDEMPEEEARLGAEKFEKYFGIKREIQERQKQIMGESRNFYGGISERISKPLLGFLTAKGEIIDDKMRDSRVSLLRHIGKYGAGSKLARGVGLGLITAGALGYIFKGDIGEAAQRGGENGESHGWVSPEEIKMKNPEIYQLLLEQGFISEPPHGEEIKKAGVELVEDGETLERKIDKPNTPLILREAASHTKAEELLNIKEYKDADTPQKLRALYDKFNEKDADLSDDVAVAMKYNQFLISHSKERLVEEYGKEAAEKVYQEAGYATYKSLENFFNVDIKDGVVTTKRLTSYLEGFKKASNFYKNSLELTDKPLEKDGIHKSFSGLGEMNKTLSSISNTLIIYGEAKDRLVSAEMRKLAYENIKEFKRLEKDVSVVHLGEGKFLFPSVKNMSEILRGKIQHEVGKENAEGILKDWVERDAGGVNVYTNELVKYINEKSPQKMSKGDQELIGILLDSNVIIKTGKGYAQNSEKPYVLCTSVDAYNHENQHFELAKNDALMKYWIKEWNAASHKFRKEFIKSFVYRNLSEKDLKILTEKEFTFEEIKKNFRDNSEGRRTQPLDDHQYEFLQEFQAYSTDNSKVRMFNPDYEIE